MIRTFDSGAARDTVQGKLDYVKALSPIVLQRYVQYLDTHRLQSDGGIRDFDNWKKGMPIDTYLSGLGRHFVTTWLLAQGFPAKDNHGPVTLEDSLAAIIFNASGWLHELLKIKFSAPNSPETTPGYGGDATQEVPTKKGDCRACSYCTLSANSRACSGCFGTFSHKNWRAADV